jgi:hypothetical protein
LIKHREPDRGSPTPQHVETPRGLVNFQRVFRFLRAVTSESRGPNWAVAKIELKGLTCARNGALKKRRELLVISTGGPGFSAVDALNALRGERI